MAGPTIPVTALTPPLSKNDMATSNDAVNTIIRNVNDGKIFTNNWKYKKKYSYGNYEKLRSTPCRKTRTRS